MFPVTTLSVCFLALMYLHLSANVIKIRMKNKISLGDGNNIDLQRAIRAHGNFVEFITIALALIFCLELNGFYWYGILPLVLTFIVGRIFHAKSIIVDEKTGNLKNRAIGMHLSIFAIIFMVIANIAWIACKYIM